MPLHEDPRLDDSARWKACDMNKNNYFSHLDQQGRHSWYMFIDEGYTYKYAGEDLALVKVQYRASHQSVGAERSWMNSPEHRENILNPVYTDVGVGYCGRYIVTHFGSLD